MPKTPDEIKKGLECCQEDECFGERENCPYTADPNLCVGVMCGDALALIQQLQAENAEKDARIQQLEAERDAAVDGLKSNCTCPECKYFSDDIQEPCRDCKPTDSKFEWRGVQKEE